jgi:squalene-hopene/tetraprenyl-beta-curcumene cyclase
MLCNRPRLISGVVLVAGAAWLAGCSAHNSERNERDAPPRRARIDRSLLAGAQFLISRQSPDGAWRSDVYGPFKDGGSLTPLVLRAMQVLPSTAGIDESFEKGVRYLATLVKPDGTIVPGPHGLSYPVYTAALAVMVLSRSEDPEYLTQRDAWLRHLRQRQLTEALGWQPSDKEYGGWGYASGLPRKPKRGELLPPLTESNLSATVFALEALRAAGCNPDDPVLAKALVFIERCQNFRDEPEDRDPAFDDGGFFFIYDDPVRNKAGVAGKDQWGRERFASYGSTTADGLQGLLAVGLVPDHPRVVAARGWLEKHFRAEIHPGTYQKEREAARQAVYYYYCCSLAQVLRTAKIRELQTPTGPVRWAEALADELLKRQHADGAWINEAHAVREDDPLVATALALRALSLCHAHLRD